MSQVLETLRELVDSPKKRVSCLWFLSMVFIFAFVFCAIAVAATNDCDSQSCSKSSGFAAMWTMLQIIGVAIGGTKVMRRYKTPLAVGFLGGVVTMLSMSMFTLFVHFAGMANRDDTVDDQPDRAAAAFCFLLFMIYAVFALVLMCNREHVIRYKRGSRASSMGASSGAAQDTV
eukprot:CAMPEP_0182472952 /NCGR_PEP_ID=MMETSP1319-20130603/23104_1 /TAXON_ID=172717 /ORGANISM="Bolidomonas pacifica, Strain RCC208" /LENGTH=173 /DNA_ID=CAMNT_0024673697 /DNA_START=51 /DNA_END=569 /DNA_ORIENTATION=-